MKTNTKLNFRFFYLLGFFSLILLATFCQSCAPSFLASNRDVILVVGKPLAEKGLREIFKLDSVNISNSPLVLADTVENERVAKVLGKKWKKKLGEKRFLFSFEGLGIDSTKTYLKFIRIKE